MIRVGPHIRRYEVAAIYRDSFSNSHMGIDARMDNTKQMQHPQLLFGYGKDAHAVISALSC